MAVTPRSVALVAVQGTVMGVLVLDTDWPRLAGPAPLLFAVAASLGLWALVVMGLKHLWVGPEVRAGARLLEAGPYRRIRHPMYASIVLAALVLAAAQPSVLRAVLLAVLLVDLHLKMKLEEQILEAHFPGYAAYRRRTFRIVPGLY